MREILNDLITWHDRGDTIALATVVKTWGSSPRGPGAKLAVNHKQEMIGSVSGGCIEGAVVEEATQALQTDRPKLLHFGVADEDAWEVGLSCGGTVDVFVEPLDPQLFATVRENIEQDEGLIVATVIRGPEQWLGAKLLVPENGEPGGPLLGMSLADQLVADARRLWQERSVSTVQNYDEVDVFFDMHRPAPRLIIVGGAHIAIDLVHFARPLGFATYIVDPRTAFASPERFPHADHLSNQWPDEGLTGIGLTSETAVVTVTHDPKLDDPALIVALKSPAYYVGALGSRKTHAGRVKRLLAEGLSQEQIDRIHAPIGLDLGGRTPAKIALSIIAEIVAVSNNSSLVSKP